MQHKFDAPVSGAVAESNYKYAIVASPTHPDAQELLAFWKSRPSGGIVIGRDVPSRKIANLLGHIAIYEPVDGRRDFRVRLAGNSVRGRYGSDIKGKLMSELFDAEAFAYNCAKAKEVLLSHQMMIFEADLSQFGITRRTYEVVLLPVLAPDQSSKWMLCGIFRFD